MANLTKEAVEKDFQTVYRDVLSGTDQHAKKLAWDEYVDSLCRAGDITQTQYDTWQDPSFIK